MVQAKADVQPNQLKSLLRTLARDTSRIGLTERRLSETEQAAVTLRKQLREQHRASQQVERSVSVLEQALRQIAALEHGKRTDRRLARAQRIASRALAQADKVRTPRSSGRGRSGSVAPTPDS
jgi:hypothetical protein